MTAASHVDVSKWVRSRHAVVAALIVLLPIFLSPFLGGEILVFSIFAMGYNLILGFGGELSFGHAAFFGVGAYATVLLLRFEVAGLYTVLILSLLIVAVVGAVLGYLSLRRRGIYFAMITLALAQMVYTTVFQWTSLTGGSNGLSFPTIDASIGPFHPTAGSDIHFYLLAAVILIAVWAFVNRLVNSPFGRTVVAIRESEERALHLGYDVDYFLWMTFVFSAAVSGLAGALYAVLFVFISPNILFWSFSGEVVLMTIIGGVGTLVGPLIGATVFVILSEYLSHITNDWEVLFGLIIIGVVIFAPEGIVGHVQNRMQGETDAVSVRELFDRLRRRE